MPQRMGRGMCWLPPDGRRERHRLKTKRIITQTTVVALSIADRIYSACCWIEQVKFHVQALMTRIVSNTRTLVSVN